MTARIIEEADAAGDRLPFRAGWSHPGRAPACGSGFLYNFLPSALAYMHQIAGRYDFDRAQAPCGRTQQRTGSS